MRNVSLCYSTALCIRNDSVHPAWHCASDMTLRRSDMTVHRTLHGTAPWTTHSTRLYCRDMDGASDMELVRNRSGAGLGPAWSRPGADKTARPRPNKPPQHRPPQAVRVVLRSALVPIVGHLADSCKRVTFASTGPARLEPLRQQLSAELSLDPVITTGLVYCAETEIDMGTPLVESLSQTRCLNSVRSLLPPLCGLLLPPTISEPPPPIMQLLSRPVMHSCNKSSRHPVIRSSRRPSAPPFLPVSSPSSLPPRTRCTLRQVAASFLSTSCLPKL